MQTQQREESYDAKLFEILCVLHGFASQRSLSITPNRFSFRPSGAKAP